MGLPQLRRYSPERVNATPVRMPYRAGGEPPRPVAGRVERALCDTLLTHARVIRQHQGQWGRCALLRLHWSRTWATAAGPSAPRSSVSAMAALSPASRPTQAASPRPRTAFGAAPPEDRRCRWPRRWLHRKRRTAPSPARPRPIQGARAPICLAAHVHAVPAPGLRKCLVIAHYPADSKRP